MSSTVDYISGRTVAVNVMAKCSRFCHMFNFRLWILYIVLLCNVVYAVAEDMKCTGKDFDNIKSTDIYKKLQSFQGKKYTVVGDKYDYFFAICDNPEEFDGKIGSAYVEKVNTKNRRSLGRFSDAEVIPGSNWVMLKYPSDNMDGRKCSSSLMIICNSFITANDVQMKILEGKPGNSEDCNFIFEVEHPDICVHQFVTFSLSWGSIFVITFICLVAVYIIGGVVYNRVLKGSKGWQQVPNYEFWQDFRNLQADGCNLVCRTPERRELRPYKGIADDQLEESDHDDHLLPM